MRRMKAKERDDDDDEDDFDVDECVGVAGGPDGEKRRKQRRHSRKSRQFQPFYVSSAADCNAIEDLNNSEYVLNSTFQLDSKKSVSPSIQKAKSKETTKSSKHMVSTGFAQDCNLQFSYIPPFPKEETVEGSSSFSRSSSAMHVDMEYHHSLVSNSLEVTREELFENAGIPSVENANSWPDSTFNDALGGSPLKNDCLPNKRSKGHPDPIQRKLFMPHWSADAVNKALEKGEAFRASFRVNVHNRLEGYCTIDGVPIDILISGTRAQNRATLISDARVLALGPKFLSVYIYKLAMERRIYIDEIEGLVVEWLDMTGALLLDIYSGKCSKKRFNHGKYRTLEDTALLVNPTNAGSFIAEQEIYEDILQEVEERLKGEHLRSKEPDKILHDDQEIEPAVFPLTLRLLSTIPVAVHAVGGDNMPLDIAVRLYLSSYLK